MKRTKRQENAIIINFILYSTLLLITVLIGLLYLYPNVITIENKKAEVFETYQEIEEVTKEGLSFGDFKTKVTPSKITAIYKNKSDNDTTYIEGILKEVDKDFYDRNFKNTGTGSKNQDYTTFLYNLKEKNENNLDFNEKFDSISKILPFYSENIYDIDEINALTDFKFIHYIESLIYNFNLNYEGSIGIGGVTLLPEYSITSSDSVSDKNISYIDLDLTLEGKKQSILELIYYFQNVGTVEIKDGELIIKKMKFSFGDDFYSFNNKTLSDEEDLDLDDYNIFNNQIGEITEIKFDNDIDTNFNSSVDLNDLDMTLVEYLKKSNQMSEKFNVNVSLRFYVKGLPKYKMENFIKDFEELYKATIVTLTKDLKSTEYKSIDVQKLKDIQTTLDNLDSFVESLSKNNAEDNLTSNYNDVYKYNTFLKEQIEQIEEIEAKYEEETTQEEETIEEKTTEEKTTD